MSPFVKKSVIFLSALTAVVVLTGAAHPFIRAGLVRHSDLKILSVRDHPADEDQMLVELQTIGLPILSGVRFSFDRGHDHLTIEKLKLGTNIYEVRAPKDGPPEAITAQLYGVESGNLMLCHIIQPTYHRFLPNIGLCHGPISADTYQIPADDMRVEDLGDQLNELAPSSSH